MHPITGLLIFGGIVLFLFLGNHLKEERKSAKKAEEIEKLWF
jgi:hypothetical protein